MRFLSRSKAAVVVALLIAGAATAFLRYDARSGRVARNVVLAGEPVGGMTEAQLTAAARRAAGRYAGAAIEVEAPPVGFSTDAAAVGLALQVEPTVRAAMTIDRTGSRLERFLGWAGSFFRSRPAPLEITVDAPSVHRVVSGKDSARTPPTEPGIREADGKMQAVEGKPGAGIDGVDVIRALPQAAARGIPIRVSVERGEVPPRFTMADARRLAAEADAGTEAGLPVRSGNKETTVKAADLRKWLRSRPNDAGLEYFVDETAATAGLRKLLPNPDPKPKESSYSIAGGAVVVAPGKPGLVCCADGAGAEVARAVAARSTQRVVLPTKEVPPRNVVLDDPAALGLREQVSTFTTNHQAGQNRVTNIHVIADLVKGQVIPPGGTFSVNELVGKRTTEKGFVVDHVIEHGVFEDSVGGGISQFATTLFNAGFFAGMEFPEYQSHSLYISRYPYGREATLSYPKPDLKIRNPSPYSVLIWPTYTGSSITVSLYSTKWVDAQQTGQTEEARGVCTLVRTERTRNFLDGTSKVDRVNAQYRPKEGINCDGSPSATPTAPAA